MGLYPGAVTGNATLGHLKGPRCGAGQDWRLRPCCHRPSPSQGHSQCSCHGQGKVRAEPHLSSDTVPQQHWDSATLVPGSPRVLLQLSMPSGHLSSFLPGSWRLDKSWHKHCLIPTNTFLFQCDIKCFELSEQSTLLLEPPSSLAVSAASAQDSPLSLSWESHCTSWITLNFVFLLKSGTVHLMEQLNDQAQAPKGVFHPHLLLLFSSAHWGKSHVRAAPAQGELSAVCCAWLLPSSKALPWHKGSVRSPPCCRAS